MANAREVRRSPTLHVGDEVIIVDVESSDSMFWLSEIAAIVCRVEAGGSGDQQLTILDQFHVLIAPPCLWTQLSYSVQLLVSGIAANVTGLPWNILEAEGVPYLKGMHAFHQFMKRHSTAKKVARDPRLEQQLLKRCDIEEACTYLRCPFDELFILKRHRPEQVKHLCCVEFTCNHHTTLVNSNEPPHCALADVMEIRVWLQRWGHFQSTVIHDDCVHEKQLSPPLNHISIPSQHSAFKIIDFKTHVSKPAS